MKNGFPKKEALLCIKSSLTIFCGKWMGPFIQKPYTKQIKQKCIYPTRRTWPPLWIWKIWRSTQASSYYTEAISLKFLGFENKKKLSKEDKIPFCIVFPQVRLFVLTNIAFFLLLCSLILFINQSSW